MSKACTTQIEEDLGLPVYEDSEAAVAHARQLARLYADALPLCEGLDDKDRGPADELIPLAVAALVAAWRLSDRAQPVHLLQALALLDAAQVQQLDQAIESCTYVRMGTSQSQHQVLS